MLLADLFLDGLPMTDAYGDLSDRGMLLMFPFRDGSCRVVLYDYARADVPVTEPVTLDEVRGSLARITGQDFGPRDMGWSGRYRSESRQAPAYRKGRIFLAGDAAHTHSPAGAQGMNTGLQDAVNLGWKLAAAVGGWAPDWLLDSYHAERHPVGAAVLALTGRQFRLNTARTAPRRVLRWAAHRVVAPLPPVQGRLAREYSGLAVRYPAPAAARPRALRAPAGRGPAAARPADRAGRQHHPPVRAVSRGAFRAARGGWRGRGTAGAGDGPPGQVRRVRYAHCDGTAPARRRLSQAGRLPGLGLRRSGTPGPGPGRPRRGPLVVRSRLEPFPPGPGPEPFPPGGPLRSAGGSAEPFPPGGPAPYHRARLDSPQRPPRGEPMPQPPRITVLGSLNMDISVTVPRLAGPGETVLGSAARLQPGGKGANQAVAAARLGASVRMAGCCGDDDFGRTLRSALQDAGVERQRGARPGRGGFRARPHHRGRGRRELDHRRARGEQPGRAAGGRRVGGHALRRPHPVSGDPGPGPGRRPRTGRAPRTS